MIRKCTECGFEADDEEYKFVLYPDCVLWWNEQEICIDENKLKGV